MTAFPGLNAIFFSGALKDAKGSNRVGHSIASVRPIAVIRSCLPVFYVAAIRASADLIRMTVDFGFERLRQGNLFPFALNACPNDVSLPPPVALSWHCPQAFPVSLAN